ncbi:galactosylceramide sulfotransferase-like [Anneissia japonica]|uniref:galactosylceramide sulfotransferase-like n=1 Tax=Anneissia japonica TaxID=1529436 RepID=UPI001425A210|nr:galactosylceramide sulfotransferase-like [Anneissia japonica]
MKWKKSKLTVVIFLLAIFLYAMPTMKVSLSLPVYNPNNLWINEIRDEHEGNNPSKPKYVDRPMMSNGTEMRQKDIKSESLESARSTISHKNEFCAPLHRVLFLKTHKTGSSTVTSILQVYGYQRNLTFAVPKTGAQILSRDFFKTDQVHPQKYDMLVNHARYNRTEMEKVMKPGAKYITILRDPRTQIESNFGYFSLTRYLNLQEEENPFRTFVSNPFYYWDKYKRVPFRNYLKNPNLFDLGLSELEQENVSIVSKFIEKLTKEFNLVLIQEHFNESLLLLKKLMCWGMDDILYLSKGTRSSKIRFEIEPELRASIRKWSWADALLYDHFNQTLWNKIKEYGPSFKADLVEFEAKLNETLYSCTLPNVPIRDNRRETWLIKNPKGSTKCTDMMRSDLDFTILLRRIQFGENEEML